MSHDQGPTHQLPHALVPGAFHNFRAESWLPQVEEARSSKTLVSSDMAGGRGCVLLPAFITLSLHLTPGNPGHSRSETLPEVTVGSVLAQLQPEAGQEGRKSQDRSEASCFWRRWGGTQQGAATVQAGWHCDSVGEAAPCDANIPYQSICLSCDCSAFHPAPC